MSDTSKHNIWFLREFLGVIAVATILLATTIPLGAQSLENGQSPEADALMVAQALALSLEGRASPSNIAPVRFADAGAEPPPDPTVQSGRFHLASSALIRFDQAGDSKERRLLAGVLLHQDPLGRLISTGFEVDYRLFQDGSIVVDASAVTPMDAPVPEVLIGFVPAEKVTGSLLKSQSFAKLFKYVEKNAVPRSQCREARRVEKEYYVFAFYMDRLARDARVGLLISDQAEGLSGYGEGTVTFQDNGWHVAYAPARFAMDGSPEIFFKALYRPGASVPLRERKEIVAGVFTSDSLAKQVQRLLADRGYDPGPADGLVGKRTIRAIKEFQQDRKLRVDGEPSVALLGLLSATDRPAIPVKTTKASTPDPGMVKRIQVGLAQWGYDPGPADAALGERTQQAIRAFQRDQGLKVDGRPSAELAARLTDSSRQAATARTQFKSPRMWPNKIQRP